MTADTDWLRDPALTPEQQERRIKAFDGLIERDDEGRRRLVNASTEYRRGHMIVCPASGGFFYWDNGEPVVSDGHGGGDRDCAKCGLPPTPEGYDPCLGYIEGANTACCGHGVEWAGIGWPRDRVDAMFRLLGRDAP